MTNGGRVCKFKKGDLIVEAISRPRTIKSVAQVIGFADGGLVKIQRFVFRDTKFVSMQPSALSEWKIQFFDKLTQEEEIKFYLAGGRYGIQ